MSDEQSFLDLGSNFGSFAEFMRITCPEINVFCCEIGRFFVTECRKRYPQLTVIEEKLSEDKTLGLFDFIYCCDVLEHIWEPDEFLKGVKKHLKTAGHLMIVTPNLDCNEARGKGADWWAYIVPHHAQIFNIKSLNALMKRHGFSLIQSEPILEEFYAIYKNGA
jgi:2-polyprenyl-3-methyl-5-hydroxy-6-metoxy-1,4-benzoquinol methylase